MSLGEYLHKNVLAPANLTDTFYWNGAPGKESEGLHKNMLPIPAYTTDFTGEATGPSDCCSDTYASREQLATLIIEALA